MPAARAPSAPAPASALQRSARARVRQAFDRCGSVSETARRLSISRTTVYRHLRGGDTGG